MIYISAQPAELYFLWQLELQLENFEKIGIAQDRIHVLFAVDHTIGIPSKISEFTRINNQARFFFYPDNRILPRYVSSVRPHILKKHFEANQDMEQEVVFYHDSDILFRERINENLLIESQTWYASDTRGYISSDYLKVFGEPFFKGLCRHVGIDPLLVENNKENSGGAQYILKSIDHSFWNSVELDSEKIFNYINWYNATMNNQQEPQAWCADMWAVLWNSWKRNANIEIHKELEFCWPMDDISMYYETKIFHNAGVKKNDSSDLFCKLHYRETTPFNQDLSQISDKKCTKVIVDAIRELSVLKENGDLFI